MNMNIEIAPTNANKFNKAIEKVSEATGLIQTSGLGFQVTQPVVMKLMEALSDLSALQSSFEVVATGKGRRTGETSSGTVSEVLTPDELARLEVEAATLTPISEQGVNNVN